MGRDEEALPPKEAEQMRALVMRDEKLLWEEEQRSRKGWGEQAELLKLYLSVHMHWVPEVRRN